VRSTTVDDNDEPKGTSTLTMSIANIRPFQADNAGGGKDDYEGYRIEAGGESACASGAAERIRRELGLTGRTVVGVSTESYVPDPAEDLVIPMVSELYDVSDAIMDNYKTGFFSLACVGDALAKTAFYRMREDPPLKNQSALRLLTANYCGKKPYTMRGVLIDWVKEQRGPVIEAQWIDGSATCMTTGRLTQLQLSTGPVAVENLPDTLQPYGCERLPGTAPDQPARCNAKQWNDAIRSECRQPTQPLPECPASLLDPAAAADPKIDFTSYIHEQPNLIRILRRPRPRPR
jgi:hypothetical protein